MSTPKKSFKDFDQPRSTPYKEREDKRLPKKVNPEEFQTKKTTLNIDVGGKEFYDSIKTLGKETSDFHDLTAKNQDEVAKKIDIEHKFENDLKTKKSELTELTSAQAKLNGEIKDRQAKVMKTQQELSKIGKQKQDSAQTFETTAAYKEKVNEVATKNRDEIIRVLEKKISNTEALIATEKGLVRELRVVVDENKRDKDTLDCELRIANDFVDTDLSEVPYDVAELEKILQDNEDLERSLQQELDKIHNARGHLNTAKDTENELKTTLSIHENIKKINDGIKDDDNLSKKELQKGLRQKKKLDEQNERLKAMLDEKHNLLGEKDRGIDELNDIIDMVHDLNQLEKKNKELEESQRNLEVDLRDFDKEIDQIAAKHQHNKDLTDDEILPEKKAKVDDLINKIREKSKQIDEASEDLKGRLINNTKELEDKDLEDIDPEDVEKRLANMDGIEDDLNKQHEELKDLKKQLDNLRDENNELDKDLKQDYIDKVQKGLNDHPEEEGEIDDILTKETDALKELDKQLKDRIRSVDDPEKKDRLERMRKDVNQLAEKAKDIEKQKDVLKNDIDNKENDAYNVGVEKDKVPENLEDLPISKLVDLEKRNLPVDKKLKDLKDQLADLSGAREELEDDLKDFDKIKQEEADKLKDRADKNLGAIDDLDKRIKDLEDRIQDTEEKAKGIEGDIPKEDQYKIDKLKGLVNKLKDIKEDVEKERDDNKGLREDQQALKDKLDEGDLDDLGEIMNLGVQQGELEDRLGDLVKDVEKSEKDLDDLNEDLDELDKKVKGDKKFAAEKALQDAENHLDDLKKKLQQVENNLDMVDADSKFLDDDFQDKEKNGDIDSIRADLEREKADLEKQIKQKDGFKDKLDEIRAKMGDNDGPDTPAEFWDGVVEEIKAVDADIVEAIEKAGGLEKEVDETAGDIEDVEKKYKKKQDLHEDCGEEKEDREETIGELDDKLDRMKNRLAKQDKELRSLDLPDDGSKRGNEYKKLCNDLDKIKDKQQDFSAKIDDIKARLADITKDLPLLPEKVVTNPELDDTLEQLKNMKKELSNLEDDLNKLDEEQAQKEKECEAFIRETRSDCLGDAQKQLEIDNEHIQDLEDKLHDLDELLDEFEEDLDEHGDENDKAKADKVKELRKFLNDIKSEEDPIVGDKEKLKGHLDELSGQIDDQAKKKTDIAAVAKILAALNDDEAKTLDLIGQVDDLIGKVKDKKGEWDDFKKDNDERNDLVDELDHLADEQIQTYDELVEKLDAAQAKVKGLIGVYEKMMNNPDYEDKQKPLQKVLDSLYQYQEDLDTIAKHADEMKPHIDKLKDAKKKGINKLPTDEIKDLLAAAKDMDEQLHEDHIRVNEISDALDNRRVKLNDATTKENSDLKEQTLDKAQGKIDKIGDILDQIYKQMEEGQDNPQQKKAIDAMKDDVEADKAKFEELGKKKKQADDLLSKILAKIHKNEPLGEADTEVLKELIDDIRKLGELTDEINGMVDDLEKSLKKKLAKLSGLDSAKKLDEKLKQLDEFDEKLKYLADEITRLQTLCEHVDGYTSSPEEESFMESLGSEIQGLKRKHKALTESVVKARKLIDEVKKYIERKQSKGDLSEQDIEDIIEEIAKVEERVEKINDGIDELDALVDKKKQRFREMDIMSKMERRDKELKAFYELYDQVDSATKQLSSDIEGDMEKAQVDPEQNAQMLEDLKEHLDTIGVCQEELGNVGERADHIKRQIKKHIKYIEGMYDDDIDDFEQIFELLPQSVEIKKQIRELTADLEEIQKIIMKTLNQYKKIGKPQKKKEKKYRAKKGDEVDQMFGQWLNEHDCSLPIKRLGNGYYMFGTRKIYAKIINGKLVIRVGGGYMGIDEFMKHYLDVELLKVEREQYAKDADNINKSGHGSKVVSAADFKKKMAASRKKRTSVMTAGPKGVHSGTQLEASLRELEADAKSGKIGDSYNTSVTMKK